MRAELSLEEDCEVELEKLAELASDAFEKVIVRMELLRDFPRSAQAAGIRGAKEVRRSVVGSYLIYYLYEEDENIINVLTVRHGARKPPTRKDLFGK